MSFMRQGVAPPEAAGCRYGTSRLVFRAPRRSLSGAYVAALGGTRTFGKGVERPWPSELETALGLPVVNLGAVGAGVDAALGDETVIEACAGAAVTVLQVTGAQALSNAYFRVHPRRNDRFLCATEALRRLYPEVDFCDYSFVRHLLCDLHACDPRRFAVLAKALRAAWSERMAALIDRIGGPVVLLWLADHAPETGCNPRPGSGIGLVTPQMIAALAPAVKGYVEVVAAPARASGPPADLPGPDAHEAAAGALCAALSSRGLLRPKGARAAG
jgi:hypothetical protein